MRNYSRSRFGSSIIAISITIGLIASVLSSAERKGQGPRRLYKADTGQFDGNRIRNDLENNGMIVSHRITGHSGMEWPKGTNLFINFASGIWIAGKVGADIRTAVGEYGPEFVAGPWGSDAGASEHQLYIVNKSDLADPLANDDFQNWPVDLGAPWVDADNSGHYNPLGPPGGTDYPEFIGDQVLWYVINDGDVDEHGNIFGTLPLGIEVQMTIWGYDRPDAFGDMMFVKALIINKGGVDVTETIIGLWSDPDLGDAGDDFVGCDTLLSLGFCYNDGADRDYGSDPPAIGYDFFQGPIVPSPGDTAFAFGRFIPDFKNLPMSSFSKYINTEDPNWSDPNTAIEMYNLMSGLTKAGGDFINSETGQPTKFVLADDPNDNTGFGDGVWVDSDDHASGDRRFLMNAGPFTLADGDSQEVVFGIIIARGSDALSSITALKEVDKLAQLAYDIQFALPEIPTNPKVTVSTLADAIVLNWDDGVNVVESYEAIDIIDKLPVPVAFDTTWVTDIVDIITVTYDTTIVGTDTTITATYDTTFNYIQVIDQIDTTFEGQNTKFTFQGFNVYQLETLAGQGAKKRIATFDLIDGVTEIFDIVFNPTRGENVEVRVQFGTDSGIKRSLVIDTDGLNGGIPLKTNRAYYFAVTAYGYNPYGIPRTLESSLKILTIRPQISTRVDQDSVAEAGISGLAATHSAGGSDGSVSITVIDPLAVTGDNYEVTFRWNADSSSIIWDLTNTTTNTMLVSGNPIQGGVDLESGDVVGVEASPIVEGIQVMVSGPALDFKNFQVVANAAGAIDPPEGAAADFQGFPTLRPTDGQQVGGGHWMFHTGGGGRSSYETFLARSMRGSNFDRLVPYDWEMRFTAEGSYAVRAFEDGLIVSVPFELWNVGIATYDDPSDDYRLIPWFLSLAGLGENDLDDFVYQVEANDHATSGGSNDPYTDWIYWRIPEDNSAGTAGYDAFVASIDFTTDPPNEGSYAYDGAEVIARSVLVNWNGGDVDDPTWPANVNQLVPEEGTIFRLISTKPNAIVDVFTFSTSTFKADIVVYDPENINVWPNPYFGFNPEERTPLERKMVFTHLPETGKATIRIFNLAGELVKKLEHSDGTQFETWDLTNNFDVPVGSGMYIVHIETDKGDKVLKLAVIQPEERLDVY